MKKVLMIAYHFPPLAGGGTFRSLKFVKYLPEFGWLPTVITTNTKNYWAYDETLLDEVPNRVKIIRAGELDPFYLQIVLSKFGLTSLYQLIKDKLFIPDEKIGWLPIAYLQSKKELKKEKYDLIFSTSPTPCTHIIAYYLKKLFNLPWVADYRDLWTINPLYSHTKLFRVNRESRMETQLNSYADKVISVTAGNKNEIKNKFHLKDRKLALIYNGFDSQTLEEENNPDFISSKKFTISYTGSFYGKRNPDAFLKALAWINLHHVNISDSIAANFCGKSDYDILNKAKKLGIDIFVKHMQFIHFEELQSIYRQSTVFLLIIQDVGKNALPAKIFHYLSTLKPILAIVPDGEAKLILKKSGLGFFARPDDVESIRDQILYLYHLWKANRLHPEPNINFINQFHRRNLTKQLADIFDSLI
ncbi:glycosyltransferase family 4 protein [candidate division KSB1 bacterium]|nr:glycosyltransferase family 4 protein [candidate division KSB1 bacterium]